MRNKYIFKSIDKKERFKRVIKAKNKTEAIERYSEIESLKEEWRKYCKEMVYDGVLFSYFDLNRFEDHVRAYFKDEKTSNAFLKVYCDKENPLNYTDLFYYAAYKLSFKELNYKPVFLIDGVFNSYRDNAHADHAAT